jgi:hypothetical protein
MPVRQTAFLFDYMGQPATAQVWLEVCHGGEVDRSSVWEMQLPNQKPAYVAIKHTLQFRELRHGVWSFSVSGDNGGEAWTEGETSDRLPQVLRAVAEVTQPLMQLAPGDTKELWALTLTDQKWHEQDAGPECARLRLMAKLDLGEPGTPRQGTWLLREEKDPVTQPAEQRPRLMHEKSANGGEREPQAR